MNHERDHDWRLESMPMKRGINFVDRRRRDTEAQVAVMAKSPPPPIWRWSSALATNDRRRVISQNSLKRSYMDFYPANVGGGGGAA